MEKPSGASGYGSTRLQKIGPYYKIDVQKPEIHQFERICRPINMKFVSIKVLIKVAVIVTLVSPLSHYALQ